MAILGARRPWISELAWTFLRASIWLARFDLISPPLSTPFPLIMVSTSLSPLVDLCSALKNPKLLLLWKHVLVALIITFVFSLFEIEFSDSPFALRMLVSLLRILDLTLVNTFLVSSISGAWEDPIGDLNTGVGSMNQTLNGFTFQKSIVFLLEPTLCRSLFLVSSSLSPVHQFPRLIHFLRIPHRHPAHHFFQIPRPDP
jgi:hypothetical protein